MELRDYQREAIEAVHGAWASGMARPALVLATGLGKTVIFTRLATDLVHAGGTPLVLVHRDELIRQTVNKFRSVSLDIPVGVIQGSRMVGGAVDVASVQTLVRRLDRIPSNRYSHIVVDECHHAAANTYVECMEHFGSALRLGVTATMGRGDGRGLGGVWDDVVFERDIHFGVENGFLTGAEVRTVKLAGLDTDRIGNGADGDLAVGQLAKAMSAAEAGPKIADAYVRFAADPGGGFRRGIVFAPKIETAESWAADLTERGVRTAVITGATKPERRQEVYGDLHTHRIDAIASVMVLTEGFDLPAVEVAVIGRPTKSMTLLTQMVGRVLRPSPETGKAAALVIDVVGAMGQGLARTVDLSIPGPPNSVAPWQDPAESERPQVWADDRGPIPDHEFVAMSITGEPVRRARRPKGLDAPRWLHTYRGTPFLPRTKDFPDLIYVGEDGLFRRKRKGEPVEVLAVRPGFDVRDLHPGVNSFGTWDVPTEPQLALLRRLGFDVVPKRRNDASELIEVHMASREIDR